MQTITHFQKYKNLNPKSLIRDKRSSEQGVRTHYEEEDSDLTDHEMIN